MDHERGHPYVAKAGCAIGAGEDPERLAGRALGSVAAVVGLLAEPAGVLGVEVGTGDDPTTGHAGLDRVGGRLRHETGHVQQHPEGQATVPPITGVRHDRGEAGDPIGVADREGLGDHPAHRRPDHVGAVDVERGEQRGGVVGEVGHRVRRARPPSAEQGLRQLHDARRRRIDLGRQPDVSVVEPDDPVPVLHQPVDEVERPHDHLGAEPHDQQHRLTGGGAVHLVLELDAVREPR